MTRLNLPAPLLLSLLIGCAADEQKAEVTDAILLSFDGDAEAVIGAAEELKVVLMHEVPYTAEATEISSWMDLDDHDGDGDDDLILNVDPTSGDDGALPVVELRPGSNTSAFEIKVDGLVSAVGRGNFSVGDITVQSTDTLGPLSFDGTVQELSISLRVLGDEERPLCDNGIDNDGDGWIGADDPDCADGEGYETNPTSDTECNDGIDNDGSFTLDFADPGCDNAWDVVEDLLADECANGTDEDGDGWTDAEDLDCLSDGTEIGGFDTRFECNDGEDNDGDGDTDADDAECWAPWDDGEDVDLGPDVNCADDTDNDGDGWIDDEDPDCAVSGTESGFMFMFACNNGFDEDTDGLTDSEDPGCSNPFDSSEEHTADCADGEDNDGDGWTDLDDPDCTSELDLTEDGGFGSALCNDGIDNDGDGVTDADDPGCESATDTDETDPSTQCNDGEDNDGDGWTDLEDPVCTSVVVELENDGTDPDGPACNDGIDNDFDGETDAEDPGCSSAEDDNEVD